VAQRVGSLWGLGGGSVGCGFCAGVLSAVCAIRQPAVVTLLWWRRQFSDSLIESLTRCVTV
jgi:hypothetical protein